MLLTKLRAKAPGVCTLTGVACNQLPPLAVVAEILVAKEAPVEAFTRIVCGDGSTCPVW